MRRSSAGRPWAKRGQNGMLRLSGSRRSGDKAQEMNIIWTGHGDTNGIHAHSNPETNPGVTRGGFRIVAENLVREFSAPVGIFDPDQRAWKLTLGAAQEQFPGADSRFLEVARSSGLRLGRVAVWRRDEDPDRSWLVLPLPSADAADMVAFVGFQASPQPGSLPSRASASAAPGLNSPGAWGPVCPEPALRPGASSMSIASRAPRNARLPGAAGSGRRGGGRARGHRPPDPQDAHFRLTGTLPVTGGQRLEDLAGHGGGGMGAQRLP